MTIRSAEQLAAAGFTVEGAAQIAARYPIRIPDTLAALIGDADDPIGRQFIPRAEELDVSPAERADPIADGANSPLPGLVHRYPDRVLLKPVSVCPVYCRFCFRREMVGPGKAGPGPRDIDAAIEYIRARPRIFEVIVSGGDPLMLAPRILGSLMGRLDAVPHVRSIRVHSRTPVADPERIGPDMADIFGTDTPVTIAVHCNHARELTEQARAACRRLRKAGAVLAGQSVLLEGVNADLESLESLFRELLATGIRPYYLHHPDLAPGTRHFRPTIEKGRALMAALRGRLPGLALPTYVIDMPDGSGKVPLGPDHYAKDGIRDLRGRVCGHPDHAGGGAGDAAAKIQAMSEGGGASTLTGGRPG